MAPVYSSTFAPPTTNKIGAMGAIGAMVPAYFSMTRSISLLTVFHRACRLKDELVTLHLVSSFCRPHLLYATDCLSLTVTQMRSLRNTWMEVYCFAYL